MTIFFYGSNTYELLDQVRQMIEKYVAKAGSDYGLERINGSAASVHELTTAIQASPFLANSRLVIIEGLALNKSLADKVPDIIRAVPKTTVAVFVDREVDQRTSVYKQLLKADKVVKFEPLTGSKLLGWVRTEIEQLGGSAEPVVLRELVKLAGENQWRLSGEINKLVNFAPVITVESVQAMVQLTPEKSIFELVEHMTAGRTNEALSAYQILLERRESEIYILTMVQWQLRNMLLAKTAPTQMSPPELAKAASMSPFVAGKMAAAQSKISEKVLRQAFIAAADCEFEIKSGRLKSDLAVEQLIYQVSVATGRP